jgi:hypothetical protein
MTAQIPDEVVWQGEEYALTGIDGGPLFDPAEHGLELRMISTACWRGHVCTYGVVSDRLELTSLTVGMDDPPAELLGAPLVPSDYGEIRYQPLRLPIPFTGGLLIGAGFIHRLYVHMGFHPAWKYERVHELVFDAGRLTAHHDRSAAMAQVRADDPELEPGDWIRSTFDRTYRSPSW